MGGIAAGALLTQLGPLEAKILASRWYLIFFLYKFLPDYCQLLDAVGVALHVTRGWRCSNDLLVLEKTNKNPAT